MYRKLTNVAQNVKKVASKNLKKPKVAESSKSCQNSKKLPKISKVAEKLPSNLWLNLSVGEVWVFCRCAHCFYYCQHSQSSIQKSNSAKLNVWTEFGSQTKSNTKVCVSWISEPIKLSQTVKKRKKNRLSLIVLCE